MYRSKSHRLGAFGIALVGVVAVVPAQQHDIREICGDCRVEKYASCGGFLEGATFDRDGTLWVVDLLSGNILSVDDSGQCSIEGNTGGEPNGAKFHRDGRLFIADKRLGIVVYDPDDGSIAGVVDTYRAERLRGTNDIVFDAEGGMYFTEPYGSDALKPTGRVFYRDVDGQLDIVADGMAFPNGLVLNTNEDTLIVGEFSRNQMISVPSKKSTSAFATADVYARFEGGIGPDGMTLDAENNVYAAHFSAKEVLVISANGFQYGRIALPEAAGAFVTNLAFGNDGYLYITEATLGEIWRVAVAKPRHPLYHQR